MPRVAPGLVVHRQHRAQRHRARRRQQEAPPVEQRAGAGDDDEIGRDHRPAGAKPACLLQPQREHAESADARPVPRHEQDAHPDDHAAEDRGEQRIEMREADQPRR